MKNVEQITKGEGYTAINIGALNNVGKYSLIHPKLNTEIFEAVPERCNRGHRDRDFIQCPSTPCGSALFPSSCR